MKENPLFNYEFKCLENYFQPERQASFVVFKIICVQEFFWENIDGIHSKINLM